MLSGVLAHPYDPKTDAVLSDINIRSYLTVPDHSYVIGQDFLKDP